MRKLRDLLGLSVVAVAAAVYAGDAFGAPNMGRAAYNDNAARGTGRAAAARMPSMPTIPINAIGNTVIDLPAAGADMPYIPPVGPINPDPDPTPNPDPTPDPDPTPEPDPVVPECPDGGVRNSKYTVENCMNDVLGCVNMGGLPNGLNDLFNEDLRNSIVNGMGLCSAQIDKCITTVRRDCQNIYRTSADVWIDFNTRKIQPEYYSFVLRKTGLTPHQAENTCWLLDKNTYGPSFAAVANSGKVTAEYNNRVGAYNGQQGNVLIKNNPQGAQVNNGNRGVDGARGHYARWDATTATCYIRVAAYNKDSQIKNSWLFGAAGDDTPAEVWKQAGDMFSCNKDLFGFSLMNDTSTVAVVGIGGGTVVGAGVGALAGHGARAFDCGREDHRKKLMAELRDTGAVRTINEYINGVDPLVTSADTMSVMQCQEIVNLRDVCEQIDTALDDCAGKTTVTEESEIAVNINCSGYQKLDDCFNALEIAKPCVGKGFTTVEQCASLIANSGGAKMSSDKPCDHACTFKPLNQAQAMGTDIYCTASTGCIGAAEMRKQVNRLISIFDGIRILDGEKNNRLKTTLIGAGVGAGAGGLATAITAFVEKSNINCRVGDGLAQVGFGKSHNIETLKDFYVKWNLRLPDTVAPTANVVDCNSWRNACANFTNLNDCKGAQINYKPAGAPTVTLIRSACAVSGSVCVENYPVAKSYGACQ